MPVPNKALNKHSQVDIFSGARFYAGRYAGIKTITYKNAPAMGVKHKNEQHEKIHDH